MAKSYYFGLRNTKPLYVQNYVTCCNQSTNRNKKKKNSTSSKQSSYQVDLAEMLRGHDMVGEMNSRPALLRQAQQPVGQAQRSLSQSKSTDSKGSSGSIPENVQFKMENSFATSFADVKIHKNDNSANEMGALAYTQGSNIHFAPGQYNPSSSQGLELLGHELTHVVQQRNGRVQPTRQGKGLSL